MKVTLISPYESISSYGMRSLSAVLKRAGFETQMILLPRETEGFRWEGFLYAYPEAVLDQVTDLASDSDLIGITLMSNYFDSAVQITQRLRRATAAPIVWGGIHATVRPEECLEHADLVCVGEGEDALLELMQHLAKGEGPIGVRNIWYKQDGEIVRTPLRPLSVDLDAYPYPDYDLDAEFVLHEGYIQPMTPDLLLYYLSWPYTSDSEPMYSTMMSRGCTYSCTYCCNNALRRVYHQEWRVRRRSVPNFIGELQQIIARFPGIRWIKIEDDVFLGNIQILREFAELYKSTIGLPLFVTGFQPSMVDEERMSILVDAGMRRVRVGIQTGSIRAMREVYRRPTTAAQLARTFDVLHRFSDRMDPPMYDLILDNPWETKEEELDTLRMLLNVPKPYHLVLYSLTFFPGTELYECARQEGILDNDLDQIYRKFYMTERRTYNNGLVRLFQSQRAPRWLMAFLLHDAMIRLDWVWLPYLLNQLFFGWGLIQAGWRALLRRDWGAFKRAFRVRLCRRLARQVK